MIFAASSNTASSNDVSPVVSAPLIGTLISLVFKDKGLRVDV